jgi:predicted nucleotidyltransferase
MNIQEARLSADTLDSITALRQFIGRASQHLRIREAYLFGSRARGDHHPDSDADLALVVDDVRPDNTLETRLKLADMAFDIMLETNILVQAHPFWRDEWDKPLENDNTLLIENVKKDGILL